MQAALHRIHSDAYFSDMLPLLCAEGGMLFFGVELPHVLRLNAEVIRCGL
jgi:hypothetical protein